MSTTIKEQSAAVINIEYYLKLTGLSWPQVKDRLLLQQQSVTSWLNGNKIPGLDAICQIAGLLKDSGCNLLFSPKQLLGDSPFSISKASCAKTNVSYLMQAYHIAPAELMTIGLPKNTVYAIYRKQREPQYEVLVKFFQYFQKKGLPVKSVLDLIYFPEWGENEKSFLQYRNIS